jgi:tetratricopeptide (TPR) repeat protein
MTDTVRAELDELNRKIINLTRGIDFREGYASLSRESREKLIGLYTMAIQGGNEELLTFFELGRMYMSIGEFDAAMLVFNRAVMDDPTFTMGWLHLSECYHVQGLIDQTIGVLQNASRKADYPGPVHHRLMELYIMSGDSAAALRESMLARKHGMAVDSVLLKQLER